ncbi:MAG: transposase [Candidatus Electryonea clarkiae]|nr:transposase [Candidatus Electryonea clarkiae]
MKPIRIPEHYEIFLTQLEKTRNFRQLNIYACVVMSNHVHLLVRLPQSLVPSEAFQGLKRTTGYQLLEFL